MSIIYSINVYYYNNTIILYKRSFDGRYKGKNDRNTTDVRRLIVIIEVISPSLTFR